MSDRSVFGIIFPPDNFGEVLLVHNRPGQRGKPSGIGCPGGGRNGSESDLDAAHREIEEETGLTRQDVEFFGVKNGRLIPQEEGQYKLFVAHKEESPDGHIKIFLVGRVLTITKRLSLKRESEETADCRWYPINSLPQVQQRLTGRETPKEREEMRERNEKKIYDGQFRALGAVLKRLKEMGEDVPIMAINQKGSGKIYPKDRPEQDFGRNDRAGKGRYGRRDFGQRRKDRPNFAGHAGEERRENRLEKPVEQYTYEE